MTAPSTGILVDTNVLVYAIDPADPVKRERAEMVLAGVLRTGRGALSAQILGEYFTTVIRKIKPPLTLDAAAQSLEDLSQLWTVLPVTIEAVLAAVAVVQRHSLSYWDALIWATARRNGVHTILTEDQNDGFLLEGVRFVNPFAPHFALAAIL